ncbi:MAG: tripartite tricarboxylate transporter substrate binding protein [Desulfobacterales bacterium]|nr:tripartite tricarboxylate transporter substrate binding protein [Desulfobacterales bacterium]
MKPNRFYVLTLVALALTLFCGEMACCEEYPEKPINMIVAYELGALTDMESRVMMSVAWEKQYLGERINIVNKRQSLRGKTGWNWCKGEACTDGYAMMGYKLPHFIAKALVYKTGSDITAFEPLANWSREPAALIVPANSPFLTLQSLIAYAKKYSGKVSVSGAGLYVGHHIAMLQLEKAAGVVLTYIPETSGMAAMHSVMIGAVKAGFNDLSAALRSRDRVRILALADGRRSPLAPEVPTFLELGVGVDDLSVCYRGVAFPKGVSPEALAICENVFPRMLKDVRLENAMAIMQGSVKIMDRRELIGLFDQTRQRLQAVLRNEIKK